MKRPSMVMTVIVVLIIGAVFFIGCKTHGHGKKHAFVLDYISETLDLSQEQESQLAAIKEDVQTRMAALRDDRAAMAVTVKEQLAMDQMDETLIRAMVEEHRSKMDGVIDLVVDRLMVFHKNLTPGQKEKLIEKIDKFESRFKSRYHSSS